MEIHVYRETGRERESEGDQKSVYFSDTYALM